MDMMSHESNGRIKGGPVAIEIGRNGVGRLLEYGLTLIICM
jgi:hypothetical protein